MISTLAVWLQKYARLAIGLIGVWLLVAPSVIDANLIELANGTAGQFVAEICSLLIRVELYEDVLALVRIVGVIAVSVALYLPVGSLTFGLTELELIRRGDFASKRGNFSEAARFYGRAIERYPLGYRGYIGRGALRFATNERAAGQKDFDAAVSTTSTDASAFAYRAAAWDQQDDYIKAIADWTRSIELKPEVSWYYLNRGIAYLKMSDQESACHDFDEAIRRDPQFAYAYEVRGWHRVHQCEYLDAINDLNEAYRFGSRSVDIFYNRASAFYGTGQFDLAVDDFSEAIRLNPRFILAYENRGHANFERSDYSAAFADYSEVIKLEPQNQLARVNRALLCEMDNNIQGALADFSEVHRICPQSITALNGMAWIYATCADEKIRDGKKALEFASRACEITEWKEEFVIDTLAAANAECGNWESAIELQQRCLASPMDEFSRQRCVERLELYQAGIAYRENSAEKYKQELDHYRSHKPNSEVPPQPIGGQDE